MNNIKISDLYEKKEKLNEKEISKIIFEGIKDDGSSCKYAIVFGSPDFQEYRVNEAIKLYKAKRIKKLILTGGIGKKTELSKRNETEAAQMKRMALKGGVLEDDIILEDKSTTTIENCKNVAELLRDELDNLDHIMLISSEWHLKRCLAISLKNISDKIQYSFGVAKDDIADKEKWKNTELGRYIIMQEIHFLSRDSHAGLIYDFDIED